MSTNRHTLDSWRLSRIAEEVEALSLSSTDDDGASTPGSSREHTLDRRLCSLHRIDKQLRDLQILDDLESSPKIDKLQHVMSLDRHMMHPEGIKKKPEMKKLDHFMPHDEYYCKHSLRKFNQVRTPDELDLRSAVRQFEQLGSSENVTRCYKKIPKDQLIHERAANLAGSHKFKEIRPPERLEIKTDDKFRTDTCLNSPTGYCNPKEIVSGRLESSHSFEELQAKDALRFIKAKYDSLGKVRVQKPPSPLGLSTNCSIPPRPTVPAARQFDAIILTTERQADRSITRSRPNTAADRRQGCRSPGAFIDQVPSSPSPFSPSIRGLCISPTSPRHPGPLVYRRGVGAEKFTPLPGRETHDHITEMNLVSPQELIQVEMFYSSHKTTINVCPCLASMYVGTVKSLRSHPSPLLSPHRGQEPSCSSRGARSSGRADWTHFKSGIPLLVLDSGEGRRRRRLHILLAEKGTGFTLWRDTIDSQSDYTPRSEIFHTMYISADRNRIAGFLFDSADDAKEFLKNISKLAAECEKSSQRDGRKKKKSSRSKKSKELSKAAISQPCCFTHIARFDPKEGCNVLPPISPVQSPTDVSGHGSLTRQSGGQNYIEKHRTLNLTNLRK